MTKQQLLALLREAMKLADREYMMSVDALIEEINRTNRVGDLELPDINELKADAVREAIGSVQYKGDSQYDVLRQLEEYADKLKRGEL